MAVEEDESSSFSLELPSLKDLSLVRVSRVLWRTSDCFHVSNFKLIASVRKEYEHEVRPTENKVLRKIDLLVLPDHLKEELKPVVRSVGKDLFQWLDPLEKASDWRGGGWVDRIFREYTVNERLLWTSHGKINCIEMAKLLCREPLLSIEERYELACKLCLEGEVRRLWAEMDSGTKSTVMYQAKGNEIWVIDYWSSKLMKET